MRPPTTTVEFDASLKVLGSPWAFEPINLTWSLVFEELSFEQLLSSDVVNRDSSNYAATTAPVHGPRDPRRRQTVTIHDSVDWSMRQFPVFLPVILFGIDLLPVGPSFECLQSNKIGTVPSRTRPDFLHADWTRRLPRDTYHVR
ncbi:hypothetical protein E4U38_000927, partial [Claviceps purpurea]